MTTIEPSKELALKKNRSKITKSNYVSCPFIYPLFKDLQSIIKENDLNKLCKKGLLERGIQMKVYFGDFQNLEDKLLKDMFDSKMSEKDRLIIFNKERTIYVEKDIGKLKMALNSLHKTINNIKEGVRSLTNKETYDAWINRINMISNRFKCFYSETNNDLYNHHFKMSKKSFLLWNQISIDSEWINNNVCESYKKIDQMVLDFDEGDLSALFTQESSNDQGSNNDQGSSNNHKKRKSHTNNENSNENKKQKQDEVLNENLCESKKQNEIWIEGRCRMKGDAKIHLDPAKSTPNDEGSESESSSLNVLTVDQVGEIDIADFSSMLNVCINQD